MESGEDDVSEARGGVLSISRWSLRLGDAQVCLNKFFSKNWESITFKKDNKPRLPQAALVRGGADADNNSPSRQVGFDAMIHFRHFLPDHQVHSFLPVCSYQSIILTQYSIIISIIVVLFYNFLVIRCTLLVEETIPRGAFVDPDEMRDLRYIVIFLNDISSYLSQIGGIKF